jgi:hypothetical protein
VLLTDLINKLKHNRMHQLKRIKLLLVKSQSVTASYLVAELIAQKRKSDTVGENLIIPVCKIIVGKMLAQDVV